MNSDSNTSSRDARAWIVLAVILMTSDTATGVGGYGPVVVETTIHKGDSPDGGVIVVGLARRGDDDNLWIAGKFSRGERKNSVIVDALLTAHREKTGELRDILARRILRPDEVDLKNKEERVTAQLDMLGEALSQYWGAGSEANKKDEL